MSPKMKDWFFLRSRFDNFNVQPERHREILVGDFDRKVRDGILEVLRGASSSMHGQKMVVYGDYGRGKTHLCHNLLHMVEKEGIELVPVNIKCTEFTSKEKFSTFFRDMVGRHDIGELRRVVRSYKEKMDAKEAEPLADVIDNDEIATVILDGLSVPNDSLVKKCLRWLGGEPKINLTAVADTGLPEHLATGREFAAVVRAFAHLFRVVDGKILLYIIDEAERIEGVTHGDTFTAWKSAIREITEVQEVAMIFFVGAISRNDLPVLFINPEIMRRIGAGNYQELLAPSRDQLREFLLELFQTIVRKGPAPEAHWEAMGDDALDEEIPAELSEILGGDADRTKTYPFEPDAFEEFLELLQTAEFGTKPSEALQRLQKAAMAALTSEKRTIEKAIVEKLQGEGF